MVFKVDFFNGKAVLWSKNSSGEVEKEVDKEYCHRIYVEGPKSDLFKMRHWIAGKTSVVATCFEEWFTDLGANSKDDVLRIDLKSNEEIMDLVHELNHNFRRGKFRFYHVSLSPQFRYCLQNKINPRPDESLDKAKISLPRKNLANKNLDGLEINGQRFEGSNTEVLQKFMEEFRQVDPDLLMVNRGQVLELVQSELEKKELGSLGRLKGFQQLAGENTIMTYGKTVHSSARYNVPGRIIVDKSNSFMLGETTIEGLWDLVDRSWKPLQELAWGSIGNLLTAIEIRKAYHGEEVLTPWKNWEGETPKKASTLHKADRGGFIFNPEPEVHEDVHEVDFASMYPNIMITRNISPETVNCNCCTNSEVPELDFIICQEKTGFIPEVLDPLVTDRRNYKEERDSGITDPQHEKYVEGAIDAIKWLLVTCFGYMGHAHASYGAIECHQAINAYARKIMRESKEIFEENGWTVKHGIIDSIWVQKKEKDATDLESVCRKVSEKIGIALEHEHDFEWVAFVPRASQEANIGTLNRYFGKKKTGGFKTAGIEVEQSSTCNFIQEAQHEMIKEFDKNRSPKDVISVVKEKCRELDKEETGFEDLVVNTKTTKHLEQYSVNNRTVAALKRAKYHGIEYKPGQEISYVVRDDSSQGMNRVKLDFEDGKYDPEYYKDQVIRAAESILSPKGLDREEIKQEVYGKNISLKNF